jgi:hypothetical protein
MKTYSYLFLLSICLISPFIFADMKIKENAAAIFSMNNSIRPSIYKITPREFSKSDVMGKLKFLQSLGFSYTTKNDTGKACIYKNESTDQYLSYTPKNSEYDYFNPKIDGFTEKDRADTNRMHSKADQYLMGLLGDDGKNFQLSDMRLRYMASSNGQDSFPTLCNKTFRYVRILDGRQVKGVTSHIIIRLGQDCRLAQFQINDNKLEKVRDLDQQIKNSAMIKYLGKHVASKKYTSTSDGREIPIKNTVINKGFESYLAKKHGSDEYLEPCMGFWAIDTLPNGTAFEREFHLTVDAANITNKTNDDFIEYETHSK